MAKPVLLVEDEDNLADLIEAYLSVENFGVVRASTGTEALACLKGERVRFVILDLNLPDMDGIDVCRALRTHSDVPVLMLTARDQESDRLTGLDIGADDYLGKPFSPRELVARMRAVLRRVEGHSDDESLSLGDVVVHSGSREVEVDGKPVALRPKEFDLLSHLLLNRGVVVTRDALLDDVWGYSYAGGTRTVDVHVAQLRRKLRRPELIRTVRGVGYKAVGP